MKKLFFSLAALLALCGEMAAHTFHVTTHGTLEQMVTDYMSDPNLPDDEFTITELIVTGEIDNKDLAQLSDGKLFSTIFRAFLAKPLL